MNRAIEASKSPGGHNQNSPIGAELDDSGKIQASIRTVMRLSQNIPCPA
jgi:hypothetical protein